MRTTIESILSALGRVAVALEAIASCSIAKTVEEVVEGFQEDDEGTVYCNITRGNHDGWYRLQGEAAITQQPVFCGRITALEFNTVTRRNQEVSKLHLTMSAKGKLNKFEAGATSLFTKAVLAAIATTDARTLAFPMKLRTYIQKLDTGDETLLVSVYDSNGNRINCDWDNGSDWRAIAIAAVENVKEAVKLRP